MARAGIWPPEPLSNNATGPTFCDTTRSANPNDGATVLQDVSPVAAMARLVRHRSPALQRQANQRNTTDSNMQHYR